MDYQRIYANLISYAERTYLTGYREKHHIIPTSLGGTNSPENLVYLTLRQHLMAHLLLYKMGHGNQIFSVECMLIDSLNPNHRRYHKIKWKRLYRKLITLQRAKVNLEQKRQQVEERQKNQHI